MCAMVYIVSLQWSSHRPIYLFRPGPGAIKEIGPREHPTHPVKTRPPVPGRQRGRPKGLSPETVRMAISGESPATSAHPPTRWWPQVGDNIFGV